MSNKDKKIEGLVASIMNARELAINVGRKDGVLHGMRFAVLAAKPLEVRDPETNEVLDTIDREKVRVEASEVREKITICRTYRITRIPGTALGESLRMFNLDFARPSKEVPETLALSDASLPPPLSEEESYVKIRDRVIQVAED